MRFAVIGASGFIGQQLVRSLAAKGHPVSAVSRGWSDIHRQNLGQVSNLISADAADAHSIQPALSGADTAFFLAYEGTPLSPGKDITFEYHRNLKILTTCLNAARFSKVRRIVFCSSGGTVYGEGGPRPLREDSPLLPRSHYGNIKRISEDLLASMSRISGDIEFVNLRISNPFGPAQIQARRRGMIITVMLQALANEPVTLFAGGEQVRDYIAIENVLDALHIAGVHPKAANQTFNIGSAIGKSGREIVADIESVCGRPLKTLEVEGRSEDVTFNIIDSSKFQQATGWLPIVPYRSALEACWTAVCSENHSPI